MLAKAIMNCAVCSPNLRQSWKVNWACMIIVKLFCMYCHLISIKYGMAQCDWTMTKSWRAWAGAAGSLTRGNFEDSCSNYNSDSWEQCIVSQNVAQRLKHLEPIQAIKHLWSMHAKRAATATIDHKLQVVYQKKYKIPIHGTHTPLKSYPSLCTWRYYASQPFI